MTQVFLSRPVTPCVGVWIETSKTSEIAWPNRVTPCVGVWIETLLFTFDFSRLYVTPCVGVWIETSSVRDIFEGDCHTLRGCVD